MSKGKQSKNTDTNQPPRLQHKKRGSRPNMERFYSKWANMHPYIASKKLAHLTKHESKNWRASQ